MIAERISENRYSRIIVVAALAVAGALSLWLLRFFKHSPATTSLPLDEISGLSEEEAASRRIAGQSNAISFHPPRSRQQIIRENTWTIFNIGLVAIVFVQAGLGKYMDALVSVGVLIFTIGINVFQEEFARIRLRKIMKEAQPKAYVIRNGQVRSVHPDAVVVGDAIAIGPGDQTVADGVALASEGLVVDESLIFAKGRAVTKQAGDELFAGSLCLSGRAAYEATRVGPNRLVERKLRHLASAPESLTPIEKIVNRTLLFLLAFVLAIAAFLLARYVAITLPLTDEMTNLFIDAIGVVFSIAPAGLFFMIVLTYAGSTVDLMQHGALVHRARSIETMAQTDVICFGKAGFLSNDWVTMTPIPSKQADDESSEQTPPDLATIHKVLGSFARSIAMRNRFSQTLQRTFDGLQMPPQDEMPFLPVYGWSGISLDDEALRGVFVLGEPDVLQPRLYARAEDEAGMTGGLLKQLSGVGERWGGLLRSDGKAAPTVSAEAVAKVEAPQTSASEPFLKRWGQAISQRVRRLKPASTAEKEEEGKGGDVTTLLFAWMPEPQPLHDETGAPQLPSTLIPLCTLDYQERINPDAVLALREFAASGVQTIIFSPDSAQETLADLRSAGVTDAEVSELRAISGPELMALDEQTFAETVDTHHIFGEVTADVMKRTVQTLRERGHLVGMVGDGVDEIQAMLQADISLTTLTASSGALSLADIILLETSPAVTARIIEKGQRIVNGLLDVLKLYLTQALYLLLLIIVLLAKVRGFPYQGAQGGMIAAFAISVPAVAITLTAPSGRLVVRHLGRHLALFVLPAAVSVAAAGYIIYSHFYQLYSLHTAAQNALVHGLVVIGLLLAVLIRPPIFLSTSLNTLARNLLTTVVAAVSGLLFYLMSQIPLAQHFTKITPLKTAADYRFVALVALLWAGAFGAYLLLAFGTRQLLGTIQRDVGLERSESSPS